MGHSEDRMQALRQRALFLLCLLIPAGLIIAFVPKPGAPRKSEAWLESQAPGSMPGYELVPFADDPDNHKISYKMDKVTYDTLKPFGIVCQVYRGSGKSFDAVIITSDSHQSFHEPRICFQSQGWTLELTKTDTIETKTHGRIPVTIVDVKNGSGNNLALFTYSGPAGFRDAPLRLMRDMFFSQLKTARVSACDFYRIIANYQGATEEELKKFASDYIDAANQSSGGYF